MNKGEFIKRASGVQQIDALKELVSAAQ